MILKWFLSRRVRRALQMRKHVWKLLSAQRDLLSSQAIAAVQEAMDQLRATCATGDKQAVEAGMDDLEKAANKWLKPYPNSNLRENVEVLLVAIAVAMGIRTFFLQPFKIPTGSMRPTLWGITEQPLSPDLKLPNPVVRFVDFWINGVSLTHVVADRDGEMTDFKPPVRLVLFNLFQKFQVGDKWYSVFFPPEDMLVRAGLVQPYGGGVIRRSFKAGEDIIKMRVVSGDHLFVDRLTYNFRRPQRGEIAVFETRHVRHANVPTDQFYIKRLVALGDEKVKIGKDRRLIIDGQPLSASTPRFERLYSFTDGYSGHDGIEMFANEQEYAVPHNHYLVMGDNTGNSLDSRYWGGFPREDVIGKAYFVYWPITSRFGWGYR